MIYRRHNRAAGFTLTEMAIVLGVVGVLVAGLWNLISGASQQARDESAASQQGQLIAATKGFLGSPDGQNYMTNNAACGGNCLPSVSFPLPLPSSANPSGSGTCQNDPTLSAVINVLAQRQTWCNTLPPGFSGGAGGTVNSYGQTYSIRALRDASLVGQAPNSYSFMIVTTGGGVVIPDTSGSRIAALIGGDGGFVYSANVCGIPATTACGSYGGWSATVTAGGYGFAGSASGTIASRTYVTPELNALSDWLARVNMPGDTTHILNTMSLGTNEYLGGNDLDMGSFGTPLVDGGAGNFNLQGGVINFGIPLATTGGGIMNAQGGNINMQRGVIDLGGGVIQSTDGAGGKLGNNAILLNAANGTGNAVITANMPCAVNSYNPNYFTPGNGSWIVEDPSPPITTAGGGTPCAFAISTTSITVTGAVQANGFYAATFIYNASDRRLKKDIHTLVDPLSQIERIDPVSFTYKANDRQSMGVIAQDIEKIYPQLVSTGEQGKYVNYEGLIAPLIGAVQELKKDNDDLRHELQEDEARQQKLEQELREGKAR